MPDKFIICNQCGGKFVFTEKQQREFAAKGFDEPRRCYECRKARKQQKMEDSDRQPIITASNDLSDRYLNEGYFDKDGLISRAIFGSEARHAAKVLSSQGTTATRLRSFLNKLQAISYDLMQTNDFTQTRVKLSSFLVAAEYAKARNVVPGVFCDFIRRNVDLATTDSKSFNAFLEHYKSVVAYARNEKNFSADLWLDGRGLPKEYLSDGYFTESGHLRREVLIEWPQALTEMFAHKKLTNTALRRFYNKLKALDGKLKGGMGYKRILPDLYAFERDAAYAAARDVVPGEFVGFVARNLNLAFQSEQGFRAFMEHFQSLIAFAKGKLNEGGNR